MNQLARVYTIGPPLTEEQVAVTFAKTSRSPEQFDQIAAQVSETDAAQFNERWVIGYGHASVAEHASVHLAIENASRLAVDAIESSRLGSFTEKSSRYQRIGPGQYHIPAELDTIPSLRRRYISNMGQLFQLYEDAIAAIAEWLTEHRFRPAGQTEAGYQRALWQETADAARNILPSATLTNVGMTANARTMSHTITRLLSDGLAETCDLGERMKESASRVAPSLIRHAEPNAQVSRQRQVAEITDRRNDDPRRAILLEWDRDAAQRVLRGIAFGQGGNLSAVPEKESTNWIGLTLSGREEHDPLPRALELTSYQAELLIDYGGLRELRRHRMMTHIPQPLQVAEGADCPELLRLCGREDIHERALEVSGALYESLRQISPAIAQYAVTHSHLQRTIICLNLRQLVELLRLRTSPRAHQSVRKPCQALVAEIRAVQPHLMRAVLGA